MKAKKKIVHYVMLVASIFMLLSVVLPHHHHKDGAPCYRWLTTEASAGGHSDTDSHDCGCNGHNIALYSSLQHPVTDIDTNHILMPLLTLFTYNYSIQPAFTGQFFGAGNAVYIESLHDTWISSASGLRAPPSLFS